MDIKECFRLRLRREKCRVVIVVQRVYRLRTTSANESWLRSWHFIIHIEIIRVELGEVGPVFGFNQKHVRITCALCTLCNLLMIYAHSAIEAMPMLFV